MSPGVALLAALILLISANILWNWRERRRILADVRREWSTPSRRTRDMAAIASYHRHLAAPAESIDDRTWRDLDLDAVYALLDRTISGVGQQLLYHRLRSTASVHSLDAFESLIARMSADVSSRERCQAALAPLRRPAAFGMWELSEPGVLEMRRADLMSPLLAFAVLAMATALVWSSTAFAGLVALLPVCLAVRVLNTRRLYEVIDAFRLLGPLLGAAKTMRCVADDQNAELTEPLTSDAQRLTRLRTIAGWIARDPATMDPITGSVFEVLNFLLALDGNALLFGGFELRRRRTSLARTIAAVGDVDGASAMASYRQTTQGWIRPSLAQPGQPVLMRDLRHPLLPEAVPNSAHFAPPYGVLITGSNMSGKSTFLRCLGVAALMSRTVNTCLAAEYGCPLMSVRSCMGRGDSLVEGRSYYLDEVHGILSLITSSRSSDMHLFLLDEIFRGTNACERVAAGEAALRQFSKSSTRHLVVAATHDVELASLLSDTYAPFHFADHMTVEGLIFDYRLTPGIARSRNAISLLEMNGAPAEMVSRARSLASRFEGDGSMR